ncbi:MAG: hypothetical protein FJ398_09095 [Verrucomicrobia bacterium]|nr:hypothetical protein [Verrucomicrobiota bacterium]
MTVVASAASHYVYVVDTSKSMSEYRAPLLDRVNLDMSYALWGEKRLYREGDQIHLWSFNLAVQEHLTLDFRPGFEQSFRSRISAVLARMKPDGGTSLYGPMGRALEQFKEERSGDLSVVLYTDGKITLNRREADYLVAMFKQYFEPGNRLKDLILVRFGTRNIRPEVTSVISALNGRIIASGEPLDLKIAPSPQPAATPPAPQPPSVISVAPTNILLTNVLAPEITKIVPLDFKVDPPAPDALIELNLEATNLPGGFSITAAPDKLATHGNPTVTFVIKGAQPGHFSAKLNLSGPGRIEPAVIPVALEILPLTPDRIALQFFSETPANFNLPANGDWQRIPTVGLSLLYPDRLKESLVRFEFQTPPGVELQALASADSSRPVETGQPVALSALGRFVGFQIRAMTQDIVGKPLTNRITVRPAPGQNVQAEGADTIEVPVRFVTAAEVRVETSEIALGQIQSGTKKLRGVLNLQAKGEAIGKKLRLVKHGQGLAGISFAPTDILLKPGAMSVDLEFTGFEEHPPGPIDGALRVVADEPTSTMDLRGGLVMVRGTIPGPGTVQAEIDNPMVAGQPFIIRVRLDARTNAPIHAIVREPDSTKDHEVALTDNGSVEDGDARANDGVYSGTFRRADHIGTYRVWFVREGSKQLVQSAPLPVPYFFKPQLDPLPGSLTNRKPGDYLRLKARIISNYPGSIFTHVEPAEPRGALNCYVAAQSLVTGTNAIDLLVGLTAEARPGVYKSKVYLVTDKIGEAKARIPLSFEITVTSFFQYLIRLVAITVGVAVLIFAAVAAPWKRLSVSRSRKASEPIRPFAETNQPTDYRPQ